MVMMRSQLRWKVGSQTAHRLYSLAAAVSILLLLTAAKEYDGSLIGVDVDQHAKLGDICITSAMKGLGSAVTDALDAYFNNEWSSHAGKPKFLVLDRAITLDFRLMTLPGASKPLTKDEYETILSGLKDGSTSVSNDTENQPEVGSHVTVDYVQ